MSYSSTETSTYTTTDVEAVMRRITADLVMIAASTGAITESKAREYAHDIELLAKNGYLDYVDVTLISNGVEQKATRFHVNESENWQMTDTETLVGREFRGLICGLL